MVQKKTTLQQSVQRYAFVTEQSAAGKIQRVEDFGCLCSLSGSCSSLVVVQSSDGLPISAVASTSRQNACASLAAGTQPLPAFPGQGHDSGMHPRLWPGETRPLATQPHRVQSDKAFLRLRFDTAQRPQPPMTPHACQAQTRYIACKVYRRSLMSSVLCV